MRLPGRVIKQFSEKENVKAMIGIDIIATLKNLKGVVSED
jgi:hypothetical protein